MSYQVIKVSSIAEAFDKTVELLSKLSNSEQDSFWFRGVNCNRLDLRPSAYWRKNYDETEPLLTFVQEGVAFADIGQFDCWDTYYKAQHHSIPTRLLDWTESFSAALFFAFDNWKDGKTPCIWVMNPGTFNHAFIEWNGIIAPTNEGMTRLWLPSNISKPNQLTQQERIGYVYNNEWPIAIYPRKSNNRINAQRGVFTVHGRIKECLIELVKRKNKEVSNIFARIDFIDLERSTVLNQLNLLGIRRSTIYPDLDNFVKQLQQDYKW